MIIWRRSTGAVAAVELAVFLFAFKLQLSQIAFCISTYIFPMFCLFFAGFDSWVRYRRKYSVDCSLLLMGALSLVILYIMIFSLMSQNWG